VPVAVGFGIGTSEQAAAVGEVADGVIIGTRLVREVGDAESLEAGLDGVAGFLRSIRG
jgi:tryptophan synthase alpha chain